MERSCGILLPVTALPAPHGVGTLGAAAFAFVDFLAAAGQRWWQMLPLGPTAFGDSPYQSFSSFAGNPYLIDLDLLCAEDLLLPAEIAAYSWGDDRARVDYAALYRNRFPLLRRAAQRLLAQQGGAVAAFAAENAAWLEDDALFFALKQRFAMRPWTQWPEPLRRRESAALAAARAECAEDIAFFTCLQFLFSRQWNALRAYAREQGVGLIGDLPIYAAADSSDVWAQPALFQLDEALRPAALAGVPPDAFTAEGQLWGNPLYDWSAHRAEGYGWWIRRVAAAAQRCDMLRLDHFRGFAAYWSVPPDAPSAASGKWCPGPGMDLLGRLKDWFPQLQFLAEDLGCLTSEVAALRAQCGFPGMKVLEFAFDAPQSDYLPHAQPTDCVCYTGTHDNAPLGAWFAAAPAAVRARAKTYLGLNDEEGIVRGLLRGGLSSPAALFLAQMQDYLGLGAPSRTNTPGTLGGNWCWRLLPDQLTPALAQELRAAAVRYGRCTHTEKNPTQTAETVIN